MLKARLFNCPRKKILLQSRELKKILQQSLQTIIQILEWDIVKTGIFAIIENYFCFN
jgi:hypothetical protein